MAALTAAPSATSPAGDRASVFKPAAQIPLMAAISASAVSCSKGTVLQVDRVEKEKTGKVIKLYLRETGGQKRLMRGLGVDKVLIALSPDDTPPGPMARWAAQCSSGH